MEKVAHLGRCEDIRRNGIRLEGWGGFHSNERRSTFKLTDRVRFGGAGEVTD